MDAHERINSVISYVVAPGVLAATVAAALPPLAALVAIVWYTVQIYESRTVQRWLAMRQLRRLARMKAAVLMMEAKSLPMPPDMGGPEDNPPV
jgi:chromate transport protein ChrA